MIDMGNRSRKLFSAGALAVVLVLTMASPALAHVTTDPDSAPQGAEITLGFRVPNEETAANTTQVEVDFATDHPLLGVQPEPVPGWTAKVTEAKLNPPVQTDDGPVSQAVSQIIWTAATGGGTPPGQFQEFHVLVQQLPKNTNQVVFKALQTYSDGNIVRWIDPVAAAGQPAPDHPTPILTLTPASDSTSPTTAATSPTESTVTSTAPQLAVNTTGLAKTSSVSTARTLGIVGITVGALGLLAAIVALLTRRRPEV
jgi:periplasmic copper chaperone A